MPTAKKKARRKSAPAPKSTLGGGRSRSGTPKAKRDRKAEKAATAKRERANERARERRAEKEAVRIVRRNAAMRPARLAKVLRREKRDAINDRKTWEKAGRPYALDKWRSVQRGKRTKALNKKREELGRKRSAIFGYATESGTDLGRVPERFQLDGRNREQWHVLKEMIRTEDSRWLDYLEAADELDLDYDEAADGWFSPEV